MTGRLSNPVAKVLMTSLVVLLVTVVLVSCAGEGVEPWRCMSESAKDMKPLMLVLMFEGDF